MQLKRQFIQGHLLVDLTLDQQEEQTIRQWVTRRQVTHPQATGMDFYAMLLVAFDGLVVSVAYARFVISVTAESVLTRNITGIDGALEFVRATTQRLLDSLEA